MAGGTSERMTEQGDGREAFTVCSPPGVRSRVKPHSELSYCVSANAVSASAPPDPHDTMFEIKEASLRLESASETS